MSAPQRIARNALKRTALFSVATAALAAFSMGSALASDRIDPQLEFAMQRDLGIFPGQVPQYLQTERIAQTQEATAKQQFGANFAGSWIERQTDGSFKHIVATTRAAKASAASLPGTEIRQVRHSLETLDAAMARLEGASSARASVKGAMDDIAAWHVDPKTNSVVITVLPGGTQAAIDLVATSGVDAGMVRFAQTPTRPQTYATIAGGKEYIMNNGFLCSIGFSARKGTQKAFITAGHCGNAGVQVTVDNQNVGSFAASRFPATDYGWVRVGSTHTLRPRVWDYSGGFVAVRGSSEAAIGASVCRSGRTTGYRCGTIRAKNVTVNYSQGTVRGLTESNACVAGGDSGGSWITGSGQGQGVTSGGNSAPGTNGNCALSAAQRFTIYQPLNPILNAYDLTLVTN